MTIDDAVISAAKEYTKSKGKSLSGIVENYLISLTAKENKEEAISPMQSHLKTFEKNKQATKAR